MIFNIENMTRAEFELYNVLEKHNKELREKMIEVITYSYFNAMLEVDRRKLLEKASTPRPRIDYFIRSIFFMCFYKLHKGDKLRAYEFLEELKEKVVKM